MVTFSHVINIYCTRGDSERLCLSNHGAPIDAYYATSRHASAWLTARDGHPPTTHRGLLNAVSKQATQAGFYPEPWSLTITGLRPPAYGGFLTPPGPCHNLASRANPYDRVRMLLRTTRDRDVKARVESKKRGGKKAPRGEYERQDLLLSATTIFDFAWRMRTRSNYGDPTLYYAGTVDHDQAYAYSRSIRTWTNATMFLFEALIAQRARKCLDEAASHFIHYDRSGLANRLIAPRLHALGLLRQR